MTALALVHKEQILQQVAVGMKLVDIAKQWNISQPAISKVLANDPDFKSARLSGALARIEYWEQQIEAIDPETNQVMLGRAREMLSHARWRAEREFPEQWGGKQVIEVHSVNVEQALDGLAASLLDKMRVVSDEPTPCSSLDEPETTIQAIDPTPPGE
jgi:hypothetical protein